MKWGETKVWLSGKEKADFYQGLLQESRDRPIANRDKKRLVKPTEMPWELAPQGILKHMINSEMNTLMETVDVYMQIIPPGSKSGKHRHLAEECLYILEGKGYDEHVDCDVEITDSYKFVPQGEMKRYDWKQGDVVYIPPNTIHQHFNASDTKPLRVISAINRIYRFSGLNDLEQIENAPEYEEGKTIDSSDVQEILERGRIAQKS